MLTVFGGGNTAFAVAANLSLRGFDVTLYEHPNFASALDPIRSRQTIHLLGVAEQEAARIRRVTNDLAEALEARGFGGPVRTPLVEYRFRRRDWALVLGMVAATVGWMLISG